MRIGLATAGALAALGACGGSSPRSVTTPLQVKAPPKAVALSSPAFAAGGTIPRVYTCAGQDISPPLRWSNIPSSARELALEMIDVDAPGGTFAHWAIAGIRPSAGGLAAGEAVPAGAVAGQNDFGHLGYGGPARRPAGPTAT